MCCERIQTRETFGSLARIFIRRVWQKRSVLQRRRVWLKRLRRKVPRHGGETLRVVFLGTQVRWKMTQLKAKERNWVRWVSPFFARKWWKKRGWKFTGKPNLPTDGPWVLKMIFFGLWPWRFFWKPFHHHLVRFLRSHFSVSAHEIANSPGRTSKTSKLLLKKCSKSWMIQIVSFVFSAKGRNIFFMHCWFRISRSTKKFEANLQVYQTSDHILGSQHITPFFLAAPSNLSLNSAWVSLLSGQIKQTKNSMLKLQRSFGPIGVS